MDSRAGQIANRLCSFRIALPENEIEFYLNSLTTRDLKWRDSSQKNVVSFSAKIPNLILSRGHRRVGAE